MERPDSRVEQIHSFDFASSFFTMRAQHIWGGGEALSEKSPKFVRRTSPAGQYLWGLWLCRLRPRLGEKLDDCNGIYRLKVKRHRLRAVSDGCVLRL